MASQLIAYRCSDSLKRACKCLLACLLTALLPLSSAQAAKLPSLVVPDGVGTNIHFVRGNEKDLDLIAAAGVRVVRVDFKWDEIERYKGVYDWAAYDELAANLAKRGIRPMFVLDYSNPLHEEAKSKLWMYLWLYWEIMAPRHPNSIAAFSRWAAAAAEHFSKYEVMWEIWNEPNIGFWKPAPNVDEYSRLATRACSAIRAADANATIVAPASSGLPWDFLESFLKTGILSCLDGVSVHPYRESSPETATNDYLRLRKLIDQYTPDTRKRQIPILSGEWGYANVQRGRSQIEQADLAIRMQLINLMNGVPLSIWYDWKNDGNDRNSHEHNFGLVQTDLSPKYAYVALKTLTAQLAGFQFVKRLDIGNDNDYALLFRNTAGQSRIAAWTTGGAHGARIPLPSAPAKVTLVNWQGFNAPLELKGPSVPVILNGSPGYIAF